MTLEYVCMDAEVFKSGCKFTEKERERPQMANFLVTKLLDDEPCGLVKVCFPGTDRRRTAHGQLRCDGIEPPPESGEEEEVSLYVFQVQGKLQEIDI